MWPRDMTIPGTFPKTVFNALNQVMKFRETIHLMRAVTFRFVGTLPVALSRLTADDDENEGEDFAIVMLGDQHPLKAFILAWNEEKDHFTGLIHLEQVSMAWMTGYSSNTGYVLDLQVISFCIQ